MWQVGKRVGYFNPAVYQKGVRGKGGVQQKGQMGKNLTEILLYIGYKERLEEGGGIKNPVVFKYKTIV